MTGQWVLERAGSFGVAFARREFGDLHETALVLCRLVAVGGSKSLIQTYADATALAMYNNHVKRRRVSSSTPLRDPAAARESRKIERERAPAYPDVDAIPFPKHLRYMYVLILQMYVGYANHGQLPAI